MIRIVHGKNPEGYQVMEVVEVPTSDPVVTERMVEAWAEAAGWSEIVVRKPKDTGHISQRIHKVPTVEWLEKVLAAWKGGAK